MIFVTGGTGMLGSRLLLDLTSRGEKVRALKRASSDIAFVKKFFSWYTTDYESLFNNIEWYEGDIFDRESLRPALKDVNKIFHLAATISFDPHDREKMIFNNVEGTISLVELALEEKIERFCHVSSIAALGSSASSMPVNEDHTWKNDRNRSAYSESKFQSEMEVWRSIYEGLDAVIVNPSVILGPGKWETGSAKLFQTVYNGMKYYTRGGTGFIDVADVSKAMTELMFHPNWENIKNTRYVLNAENLSFRELFNEIAETLGKTKPSIFAGSFLVGVAWRLSALTSFFTGKPAAFSKETARNANKTTQYDGSKILKAIGYEYTPIKNTIVSIADIFVKDHQR
jgi:nucleoside-diphosphate-sugar epimerase